MCVASWVKGLPLGLIPFIRQANKLKEIFGKRNMHDAPILQLVLLDIREKEPTQVFEFIYSPNYTLEHL